MKTSREQLLLLPADVRKAIAERELRRRSVARGGADGDEWRLVLPFFRTIDTRHLIELLGGDGGPAPGLDGHRQEEAFPEDALAAMPAMLRQARANMGQSLVPVDEDDPAATNIERQVRRNYRRDNGLTKAATPENFAAVDRLLAQYVSKSPEAAHG